MYACTCTRTRSFVRSFVQLTIASTLQSAPRGGSIPRARRGGARNFYPLIRLDDESEVSKRPRRQSYQSPAERKKEAAISNNYRRGYSSCRKRQKFLPPPFTVNKPRTRRRMQLGIYTRISPRAFNFAVSIYPRENYPTTIFVKRGIRALFRRFPPPHPLPHPPSVVWTCSFVLQFLGNVRKNFE